jgi:hypothetical protein
MGALFQPQYSGGGAFFGPQYYFSGDAIATVIGVSAAGRVGPVTAQATVTGIGIVVTDEMVCATVRDYIKSIAPTLRVIRTPVNRAAMPNGPYVSFTPGLRRPLATNVSVDTGIVRTVTRSEQMSFQIDCYGDGSADLAEKLNILYRDPYGVEMFAESGYGTVPLYAGEIQQAPFTDDSDQYEDRYTFEIELQVNSTVVIPLQSCNILNIDLVSVDATFPPIEE